VNNKNNLDDFFSFISKVVIIIPIVVVVLSLMFKFGQTKTGRINPQKGLINQTPTTTKDNSIKLDLQGPIVCNSLFIKDKKVLFKNKQSNYLLNGDCFYTWETGKLNGVKECGLENYINLAEKYSGLLNINDLANNNMVKDFIKGKNINVENVLNSCKKKEIANDLIFEVPEKILFIKKK